MTAARWLNSSITSPMTASRSSQLSDRSCNQSATRGGSIIPDLAARRVRSRPTCASARRASAPAPRGRPAQSEIAFGPAAALRRWIRQPRIDVTLSFQPIERRVERANHNRSAGALLDFPPDRRSVRLGVQTHDREDAPAVRTRPTPRCDSFQLHRRGNRHPMQEPGQKKGAGPPRIKRWRSGIDLRHFESLYKLSHKQRERAEASEPRERSGASGSPRASV